MAAPPASGVEVASRPALAPSGGTRLAASPVAVSSAPHAGKSVSKIVTLQRATRGR
jgi:hypothetical protein